MALMIYRIDRRQSDRGVLQALTHAGEVRMEQGSMARAGGLKEAVRGVMKRQHAHDRIIASVLCSAKSFLL